VEITDDGCGMDPEKLQKAALGGRYGGRRNNERKLDLALCLGVSTKGTAGFGLRNATETVEEMDGKLFIKGTTYQSESGLVTIGDHPEDATGTTIRIEFPYDLMRRLQAKVPEETEKSVKMPFWYKGPR